MKNIKIALWAPLALLTAVWLAVNPAILQAQAFFPLRGEMVQITGVLAMACMSIAMMLALRPRWPEKWFGGLDKMYRLHKWLGITALVLAVTHWLWAKGPKWAVGFGLLERPARGPRPIIDNAVEQFLSGLRGTAEGVGEWAFYAAAALIVLALIKWFPYRLFFKTHRLIAVAYLVLVFHAVVLVKFANWLTPVGAMMALLLAGGTWAALVVLFRRVAADRKVDGEVVGLRYFPELRVLETRVKVGENWPGHRAGQFAFAMSDPAEGPHPYTIASAWNPDSREITFIVKELGDHTERLRHKLEIGHKVTIEGPYGCFTFDDPQPRQIWIGGGIGITPFIAKLEQLAADRAQVRQVREPAIDLFHTTSEYDPEALALLEAHARAAGVRLHLLVDARDGRLDGEKIRQLVPEWREASFWFCGPTGFGQALRDSFAACGLPVAKHFHQELFAMR